MCGQCSKANRASDCQYYEKKRTSRTQLLQAKITKLEARLRELEAEQSSAESSSSIGSQSPQLDRTSLSLHGECCTFPPRSHRDAYDVNPRPAYLQQTTSGSDSTRPFSAPLSLTTSISLATPAMHTHSSMQNSFCPVYPSHRVPQISQRGLVSSSHP